MYNYSSRPWDGANSAFLDLGVKHLRKELTKHDVLWYNSFGTKEERKLRTMKTTVRATLIVPDSYVSIQRLYDKGTFFRLEEERLTGHHAIDFIQRLRAAGGTIIEMHQFIDDDDFKEKWCATYEYTTE